MCRCARVFPREHQRNRRNRGMICRMRSRVVAFVGLGVIAIALALSTISPAAKSQTSNEFDSKLKPLLVHYCYDCHGNGEKSGEFSMDSFQSGPDLLTDKAHWEKAVHFARAHMMPPPEADAQPSPNDRDQIVRSIQTILYNIDPAHPD